MAQQRIFEFRPRHVIVEEARETDEHFSVRLGYPMGAQTPSTGEFLQFKKPDGGYTTYVVTQVIHREVPEDGESPDFSLYDLYILVARCASAWKPL